MTTAERATFIRIRLLQVGQTQVDVGRGIGVTVKAINNAIHGRESSRRVKEAIAAAIGVPVRNLFPEVYRNRRGSRGSKR